MDKDFIKHCRIRSGKDINKEIERIKQEMERDGIVGFKKLTEEDRGEMREKAKEKGWGEVE